MLAEDETDPEPIAIRHFYADPALLAAAQHVRHGYTAGQVVEGIIGSADVWNNELDRIAFFERLMAQSPRKWKVLLWHKLLPSFRCLSWRYGLYPII
jgi:hypothetical protein